MHAQIEGLSPKALNRYGHNVPVYPPNEHVWALPVSADMV
jgi:hypothetical protein